MKPLVKEFGHKHGSHKHHDSDECALCRFNYAKDLRGRKIRGRFDGVYIKSSGRGLFKRATVRIIRDEME